MTRSLLDVNVLLALLDSDHVDHDRAHRWLDEEGIEHGWASCAITENGFVRVISQPRYPSPVTPSVAVHLLRTATEDSDHTFWPCDVRLLDPTVVDPDRLLSHRQITDAYLLALATAHGGRLVTFDRGLDASAVPRAAPTSLVVL